MILKTSPDENRADTGRGKTPTEDQAMSKQEALRLIKEAAETGDGAWNREVILFSLDAYQREQDL
jgi:hypothetical protein